MYTKIERQPFSLAFILRQSITLDGHVGMGHNKIQIKKFIKKSYLVMFHLHCERGSIYAEADSKIVHKSYNLSSSDHRQ